MTRDDPLPALTASDFRAVLGTQFRITVAGPGGGALSLAAELADVTEQAGGPAGPFRKPFSVVFRGPPEPVLPQGMYLLEHERLGALEVLVVPIGPAVPATPGQGPAPMRYEAVFG